MDLQAVSVRLGVHYQTVYRWVRQGRLEAVRVGPSYHVSDAEVERIVHLRSTPVSPPSGVRVRSWEQRRARLLDALLRGDEVAVREVIEPLAAGRVALVDLCERLIVPCLVEIGDGWHGGAVSVAEEHRATAICERTLARIAVHPRGRPRGTVLITSAFGDSHALASVMAALVLRADHWQVHHLGGNLPDEEVERMATELQPNLIVISLVEPQAADAGETLRDRLSGRGFDVLLGGPGATLSGLIDQARLRRSDSALHSV